MQDATFAPTGDLLALLDSDAPAVSFFRVAGGGSLLSRWGNAVDVEKDPSLVRFTSDGILPETVLFDNSS